MSPKDEQGPNQVSDGIVRKDFKKLYQYSESPANLIIIDNAQYLGQNSIILQKLKNIFSDIQGYVLVLSGTEETFSEINDAFSPAARLFNKHEIGPLSSFEKVKKCVLAGLSDEERGSIDDSTILDIYRITGGRPYEINLIGYYMYRHFDQEVTESLSLNADVINEVINQIDMWRRPVDDDLISEVNSLENSELQTLLATIECYRTPKDILINYVMLSWYHSDEFSEMPSYSDAEDSVSELVERGLLEENNDNIEFSGGIYSLSYIKYLSYSKGILPVLGEEKQGNIRYLVPNIHKKISNDIILSNITNSRNTHTHFIRDDMASEGQLQSLVIPNNTEEILPANIDDQKHSQKYNILSDLSISGTSYAESRYHESSFSISDESEDDSGNTFAELCFRVNIEWLDMGFLSIIHAEDEMAIDETVNILKHHENKLEELGIDIILDTEVDLVRKAESLMGTADNEEVISKLERAIDINDNFVDAWYYKSRVSMRQGDYKKALSDVENAIQLRDDWTDAYVLKGCIKLLQDNWSEAERIFNDAAEFKPEDDAICWPEACCMLDKDDYPEAAIYCGNKAVENNLIDSHTQSHRAKSYSRLGQYEECVEICRDVLSHNDKNIFSKDIFLELLSFGLNELGEKEEALNAIENAENACENSENDHAVARICYNKACLLSSMGEISDAIESLRKSIRIDPTGENRELAKSDPALEPLWDNIDHDELMGNISEDVISDSSVAR